MSGQLFDPGPSADPPPPGPVLSADRRRTIRQRRSIELGTHPVTRRPLLDPEWGFRCGDCTHLVRVDLGRTYIKCDRNHTGGAATDVRVSWPACTGLRIRATS